MKLSPKLLPWQTVHHITVWKVRLSSKTLNSLGMAVEKGLTLDHVLLSSFFNTRDLMSRPVWASATACTSKLSHTLPPVPKLGPHGCLWGLDMYTEEGSQTFGQRMWSPAGAQCSLEWAHNCSFGLIKSLLGPRAAGGRTDEDALQKQDPLC